ncbi:MAG TPA: hypothetical protein VGY52_14770 [Roseiarcus sp.]|nr:hypothetical protein [Roseiarcus sp.]
MAMRPAVVTVRSVIRPLKSQRGDAFANRAARSIVVDLRDGRYRKKRGAGEKKRR